MNHLRATTPNEKARNAFPAAKREIDAMLTRTKKLSDYRFKTDTDAIHGGDVGTLNH